MSRRIIFMGTPTFSVPILEALIPITTIIGVFSQPDKAQGRGKKMLPCPVREKALQLGLPTFTPTLKDDLTQAVFELSPDLIIVVAYGMILPKAVTDTFFCINIHASLLPLYRGASPIQSAILNRDTVTGITLIHMNEKMDEGPMLIQEQMALSPDTTFGTLHDQLAALSARLIHTYLSSHPDMNKAPQQQQINAEATYCKKIQKDDLILNRNASAEAQLAQIKAYSPVPGTYVIQNNKRIKVMDATLKNGTLVLLSVKPEGKGIMSYEDYCKGNPPLD